MDYYEIGQRIRKFRKTHNLSQEKLAEKIGISVTHMSHIETGNTKLSLPVLVSLAEVLDVQTDELLFSKTSRGTVNEKIVTILDGCSTQQLNIIADVIKSTKTALDKYC